MDKQKYSELARKILRENIKLEDRLVAEDELVEIAYKLAGELEVTPEEFETKRDDKRAKNGELKIEGEPKGWLRKKLEEKLNELQKMSDKAKITEGLGDVLEVVETYTARF